MWRNASAFTDGSSIRRQIAGHLSLEDPAILQRDSRESLSRYGKILGEHLGRRMGEPVGHEQRVKLAGVTVVEADHEFAAVRAEALQRMRLTRREIPEITLIDIGNVGPAQGVEYRHAATAVDHDRPL